mgnify:CR=1 FL=1
MPEIAGAVPAAPHALARLRSARLAHSSKPFLARGGPKGERCPGCRLRPSHCLCALRPQAGTRAGFCLLMGGDEPLKPSNTGWLVADVVADSFAFGWARTTVDPALLALLADPKWQPYLVFPDASVAPERVVHAPAAPGAGGAPGPRPLFILLDATWTQAHRMFRRSPYLDRFPVLALQPEQASRYRLRRASRDDQLCTAEVAALCLGLAGEAPAGALLEAWLDVFSAHYLAARNQRPADPADAAHQRLAQARRDFSAQTPG